jgi:hypothetical protein
LERSLHLVHKTVGVEKISIHKIFNCTYEIVSKIYTGKVAVKGAKMAVVFGWQ